MPSLSKCLNYKINFLIDVGGSTIDSEKYLTYERVYGSKKASNKIVYSKLIKYILIEKGGEITDVIEIPAKKTFSAYVKFNNEYKQGFLIGSWNKKKLYLKIEELYRISEDGKLIKLNLNEIDKIAEFPFIDSFNDEEDDGTLSIDDFRFGL